MMENPVLETRGRDVAPVSNAEQTKSKKRSRTGLSIPVLQFDAREQLWEISKPKYSPYRIFSKVQPYYRALRFTTTEYARAADSIFNNAYPGYPQIHGRLRKQLVERFKNASSEDAQLLLLAITHVVAIHCRDLLFSVPRKGESLAQYGTSLAMRHRAASWWYAIWKQMMEARGKELEADVFNYL